MAGRDRGTERGRGETDGVNERALFAPLATRLSAANDPALESVFTGRSDNPVKPDAAPWRSIVGDEVAADQPVVGDQATEELPVSPWRMPSVRLPSIRRQARRLARIPSPYSAVAGLAAAAATELDRGVAFLLVPVFLSGGAIFYFSLAAEPGFVQPIACAVAFVVAVLLARARPRLQLALAAALLVAVGVLCAKVETWRASTLMLGAEVSTRLTGRVVAIDAMASGRQRLTLDVVSTRRPALRYQPARVRLSARAVPAGLVAGDTVSGFVRLLPPTGPVRPDSYDFSFESYFAGIGASGFFLSNPKLEKAVPASLGARLPGMVERARDAIADRIRAAIGGPEGEIAAALMVGVRAGIPESINEAMRKTGIYHIISISGLHMALVAGTVMALLRGAFALFPNFSSRRPVKKYAAGAALFAIAAYLFISGVVVAAERSFIMLAVMLTAVLFDRAALTMRNLAISAIAVVVVSPHEVVGPSFQMSFAATAALVGAYAGWSDRRAARGGGTPPPNRSWPGAVMRRMVAATAALAATSIVAGSATTLYAMWHFQRVAPLSLFANLAVMPIVSVLVMPFAVFAALAMPFGADWPFLYVMGKGLAAMIAISSWIAEHSPLDAVGLVSVQSVLLVTVALVIATMTTTWLRLTALPFALAGLVTIHQVRTPDVLVSEDARLVALPIGGGELAVSRPRPNEFTADNWRRALDAETLVKPEALKGKDMRFVTTDAALDLPPGTPFLCAGKLCIARHTSGAIVVWAQKAGDARPACAYAALIVIADATAKNPCRNLPVAVVTARDLARSGSAAVTFDPVAADQPPQVRFAVEENYRPWHAQRAFSREARGLAPYQRKTGDKKQRRQRTGSRPG
ncbi:MAG: ComEC/Rec2 family competence protein [Mesorhizobium sp.]